MQTNVNAVSQVSVDDELDCDESVVKSSRIPILDQTRVSKPKTNNFAGNSMPNVPSNHSISIGPLKNQGPIESVKSSINANL